MDSLLLNGKGVEEGEMGSLHSNSEGEEEREVGHPRLTW